MHHQALSAVVVLSAVVSVVVYLLIKATLGLRVTEADEFDGLDLGEHDINALLLDDSLLISPPRSRYRRADQTRRQSGTKNRG